MERTNRNVWIGFGLIVLLVLLGFSVMGGAMLGRAGFLFGYGARPFFGMGPWVWGIGLVGLLVRLAFWGVLIALAVALFRRMSGPLEVSGATRLELSPLEILKRRYAAGEITREQFDEMRRTLEPSAK
jgi:putative membrane protein